MNKSILIVDDDQDFSDLLKGIFQQAGYTVHLAFSADQGFEMLEKANIELIVSDHRLPGRITGAEFVAKLRKKGITLPVIVVSGFLNDEAIRELIRDGVEGIFIKPLNIFSLLKKASDTLEARQRDSGSGGAESSHDGASASRSIGRIKGESSAGQEFLKRARKAAQFRRNLLLIGPRGTLFEEIARDIVVHAKEKQRTEIMSPGSVSEERIGNLFAEEKAEEPVTLILTEAESLSAEEVDRLIQLGDEKGGSDSPLRMIFCLSQSVEELYDNEIIDEDFYLFLGANELTVPPLDKMPEDLLEMARDEIMAQSKDAIFDMKLRTLLLSHPWEENFVELKSVIVRAVTLAQPMAPTVRHFEAALDPHQADASRLNDVRSTFERFLLQEKQRYEEAMQLVTGTSG
jgi:two-component system response regulator HydG